MTRFPTNYLILEGPDLSGKTTFYAALHKASSYAWNIQDRSCLSMIIHADQYNRSALIHKENFKSELLNLNNRFVILLPDLSTIVERYKKIGDEIQALDSVKKLYLAFSKYAEHLDSLPNVQVIRTTELFENACSVKENLLSMENASLDEISSIVLKFVENTQSYEAAPLSFTLYDDGKFAESDSSIMDYASEKEYYEKLLPGILLKIENELTGKNQYNRVESILSRRFIHTNDSCISLIHASYRDLLDMHFVLRSSEVKTTFKYDLKFLYYLSGKVYKALNLKSGRDQVRMRFNLNSAHILV